MKEAFRRKACSLQEVVGRDLSDPEVIEAVSAGFAEAFGVELVSGDLTPQEMSLARELAEGKYASEEWTRKR